MKKRILFIEDVYSDYEELFNGLSSEFHCFPDISSSEAEFVKFKLLYYKYIIRPSTENENALLAYIDQLDIDVFIVDISLFVEDRGRRIDFTGGLLRKNLLSRHYPLKQAIVLTQYLDHEISEFKQEGDIHVYKYEFNGVYPNDKIIDLLSKTVDRLANKLKPVSDGI